MNWLRIMIKDVTPYTALRLVLAIASLAIFIAVYAIILEILSNSTGVHKIWFQLGTLACLSLAFWACSAVERARMGSDIGKQGPRSITDPKERLEWVKGTYITTDDDNGPREGVPRKLHAWTAKHYRIIKQDSPYGLYIVSGLSNGVGRALTSIAAAKECAELDFTRATLQADPVREAARVLLDACPNPIFDRLKSELMGEFSVPFLMNDEDGEEHVHQVNVPWAVMKRMIKASLHALAQKGD